MQLYNHRIVKCPLAFQSVHYGIFRLKKYWRFFQPSKILPTILKDSSNRQRFFQLSKKILPTIKDSSNCQKRFFQPSKILPTVREKKIRLAVITVNYLLRIILNIGFINIKMKHLYSINRPGRLLEGGAYFQHFKIRWALIRRGA